MATKTSDFAPGEYVLTVGKFMDQDGTEHSYGDVIDVEDEKEVKRLLNSNSIAAPDSTAGRKARAEATNDPVEKNRLIAEEKRAQAERLLAEAETLEGGETKGEEVAEEARKAASNVGKEGGGSGGEGVNKQASDQGQRADDDKVDNKGDKK